MGHRLIPLGWVTRIKMADQQESHALRVDWFNGKKTGDRLLARLEKEHVFHREDIAKELSGTVVLTKNLASS